MRKLVVLAVLLAVAATMFASGQKEAKSADLTTMTFITPRGTVEVMDDYNLWVAIELGYFREMGLNVIMEPGPMDAFAATKFVDQRQADVGYPSPGILTASVDTGMDVIMVYEMMIDQVFDFAVRQDSPIRSLKDFPGKTIALGDLGWQVIVDPILVENNVDPASVTYVAVGAQWGQAVALGRADIALTWKGLRAQWDAQGLGLRYLLGETFSKMPANGYCARKSDLADPARRELLAKFLRGTSMGIHFARHNPRAAAQIVYSRFATIREQMSPELALQSMQQLHWGYVGGRAARPGIRLVRDGRVEHLPGHHPRAGTDPEAPGARECGHQRPDRGGQRLRPRPRGTRRQGFHAQRHLEKRQSRRPVVASSIPGFSAE
jgi:NitT/TauT family transport system substrate-binding protein